MLLCFWACIGFTVASARGEATPTATSGVAGISAEEQAVADKRAALEQELDKVRARTAGGEGSDTLDRAVNLLESLDLLYEQHLGVLKEAAQREAALKQAKEGLKTLRASGLPPPPPYSLVALDQVHDEIDAESKRAEMTQVGIRAAQDALERAQEQQNESERARRAAKEALETNSDPSQTGSLENALYLAQLQSRLATEQAQLRARELKNEQLAGQQEAVRTEALREKAERLAKAVRFTRDQLQEQLAQLEKKRDDLTQSFQDAKAELATAERQWSKARQKAERAPGAGRALTEEVEARHLALQTQQIAVNLLSERLQRLKGMKEAWERRYEIISGAVPRARLSDWKEKTQQTLDELDREMRVQRARLRELQDERVNRSQALDSSVPADVARWIREQEKQLDERIRVYEASLSGLDGARDLYQNLLQEIQQRLGTKTLGERLDSAWQTVRSVWGYEIAAVDDRPITIGKILIGIILFSLGLLLAGYASRQLGQRLFPRLGLAAGGVAALESLSFYVFVTIISLIALRIINVPLTAFTLLGGAVAIGLGFGSQNIVNNFISGLILFAERPIRIGDMIEVDGTYGTVEHIGARSTRVRSFNNIHIIVPNSSFLEKNVVNWTLSDDHVRTVVGVGVAYGSPTREVEQLMRRAVKEHDKILNKPEPMVLFADFGDNALTFEVHFWLRMRTLMDRRLIESDVRYRIDALFREAGITIAFPQRDVHLDTLRPLEVRVVENGGGGG